MHHSDNSMDTLRIGLISVSDRAANGIYQDQGIPALESWLGSALTTPFEIETRLVPDEQPMIEQAICELVDELFCHLVLTTGGTGPARRDVTPDATLAVADREMPGFGEQITPEALLRWSPPAEDQCQDKKHNKDKEKDFGDLCCRGRNTTKAKKGGNQRNHQEDNGPTYHGGLHIR